MQHGSTRTNIFCLLLVVVLPVLTPSRATGQAWVPGARRLLTTLSYQYLESTKHLFSEEDPATGSNAADLGLIFSQTSVLSFDYGATNRLSISGGVSFIGSMYYGPYPESEIDDGEWHAGLQDLSLGVRYNVLVWPVVVTPSIGVVVPTNEYQTIGHSATGAHLSSVGLGINVGWAPRRWLQGSYISGSYVYAFEEDLEGMDLGNSTVSGQVGYFILPYLSAGVVVGYARAHGGLDWAHDLTEGNFHAHDRAAASRSTSVGGGVSYSVSNRYSVSLSYSGIVAGANTHNAHGFMLSNTWTFNAF